MSIYWLMLLIPMVATLHSVKLDINLRMLVFWLVGALLIFIIGLRYEIGGDWDRYLSVFSYLDSGPFFENFRGRDIGYEFLYWISIRLFDGIYFVNIISAIIFVIGLIRFCSVMPFPWLAMLVSVPFLIIVVSMGYTRQAAAVGLIMWGLVDLMKGKRKHFYAFSILAALFHSSAVIMLPIGLLYNAQRAKLIRVLLYFVTIIFGVYILFQEIIGHMYYYYITIKFHNSEGAVMRILMTFSTAIVFFIFRARFKKVFQDEKLWLIFSIISILLLPLAFFYSTFADRIAIYFLPLQLVVLSRVPVLITSKYNQSLFVVGVVITYSSALFVWLIFGKHSSFWLPYKNILLM